MEYFGLERMLEVTWATPACSPKRAFAGLAAEDHKSFWREADCQCLWRSYWLWEQVALLTLKGRDTKAMLKKIHQERMTTRSQIAGNIPFHLYTNHSVKCNKPMVLQVIPPPGLSSPKCISIIITVRDCHLLLPSQGLLHKKISAYFLYGECCFHQELSASLKPRMRHLAGSSQRAQEGLKLVDSISAVATWWRSYWRIQLLRVGSYGQWDTALLDPVQLKRQITKKSPPQIKGSRSL